MLIGALSALVLAGCARDASPAAAPASTTTIAAPLVPAPEDGALRARIDAVDVAGTDRGSGPGAPDSVLLVGDSVLVAVADELATMLDATLHVDAVNCRKLVEPIDGGCGGVPAGVVVEGGVAAVERALRQPAAGPPDAVVLVLANNATFEPDDLDAAMGATAGVERVWWVNARIDGFGRQDINNRLLQDLAVRDPRAGVIDWFGASAGEDWFVDHVHPDDEGQAQLGRLIAGHVSCGCVP